MPTEDLKDSGHKITDGRRQPLSRLWHAPRCSAATQSFAPKGSLPENDMWSCLDLLQENPLHIRQRYKQISAKTVIFYKGDPATHLFIILSGKVKVSAPSAEGKEITFGILGHGELVGEVGVLEGVEHSATVTALVPTVLSALDRRDFLALVDSHPGFALKILRILCKRLRGAREMAEDIFFLSLSKRLAKTLHALGQAYGELTPDGVRIGLHLCQQELANLVVTSRESVNKQLRLWEAEGLVTMDQGYLILRNMRELLSLSEQQEPKSGLMYPVGERLLAHP